MDINVESSPIGFIMQTINGAVPPVVRLIVISNIKIKPNFHKQTRSSTVNDWTKEKVKY